MHSGKSTYLEIPPHHIHVACKTIGLLRAVGLWFHRVRNHCSFVFNDVRFILASVYSVLNLYAVMSTASQQLSCINHKFILGVCVCSTCIVCYFHNFCKQKSNGKGLNVYNMTTGCFKLTWAEVSLYQLTSSSLALLSP